MSTAKPPPPRPPTCVANNERGLGYSSSSNTSSSQTGRNTQPAQSHVPVPAPRRSGTGRLSTSLNTTQVGNIRYLITVGVEIKECQRACDPMTPAETANLLVSKINGELRKFGIKLQTEVLAELQAGIADDLTQLFGNTSQFCCICRNLVSITIRQRDV